MSEIHQRANRAAGRSKGSKKDFNRRKIRNPNGRIIDYGGRQYQKLLLNGYKENDEKKESNEKKEFQISTELKDFNLSQHKDKNDSDVDYDNDCFDDVL